MLRMEMTRTEAAQVMTLACGRLMRLLSRPYQAGDEAQYQAARAAALDAADVLGMSTTNWSANYARDRNNGAAGD